MVPFNLKVGSKIKDKTSPIKHMQYLYHVRAFVDDRIVVRYWSKRRQRWIYDILDYYFLLVRADNLTIDGKNPTDEQIEELSSLYKITD